uniref:Uncharacterized protein n=1 Tax=Talaromyces marneffei PM1 TaxID=1077442 RepID=A0A093XS85_TALMA
MPSPQTALAANGAFESRAFRRRLSYLCEQWTRRSYPQDLFSTIHDVTIFAWGIVGIDRPLEQYRRGQLSGDALPPDGIPIGKPQPEE